MYFILGQINSPINVFVDISKYQFQPDEIKIIVLIYEIEAGAFKGLMKTVGLMSIRGGAHETFLNYISRHFLITLQLNFKMEHAFFRLLLRNDL